MVWGLSAVLSERPQARGEAFERGAQALARVFRDPQSVKHYCRVMHRAVQREFAGYPAFAQLQHAIQAFIAKAPTGRVYAPTDLYLCGRADLSARRSFKER